MRLNIPVCLHTQVSLIALGPLTNLALAVNLDPTFPQKLKDLYIMGGNMEGKKISCCTGTSKLYFFISVIMYNIKTKPVLRTAQVKTRSPNRVSFYRASSPHTVHLNLPGKGNLTPTAEFNFRMDAESAYVVLEEYTCSTHIATWEFTCRNKLSWVRAPNMSKIHSCVNIIGLTCVLHIFPGVF